MARAFSDRNPWFAAGGAALAMCAPGRARLGAFDPGRLVDGERVAFFGTWETTGGVDDCRPLFERAEAWARARGAARLVGPIDFSTYGRNRLRVAIEPADAIARTFPGEPYNPAHYPAILEALGFSVLRRYVSHRVPSARLPGLARALEHHEAELVAAGFRFEALSPRRWLANLDELHAATDAIFGDNYAYTSLAVAAFRDACGERFVRRACPRSSTLVFAADGAIAAFMLQVPNYGELVVQGAGDERVEPDALDYAVHYPRLRARGPVESILKTAGVMPAYRASGVVSALTARALRLGRRRYHACWGALMREDNWTRRISESLQDQTRWYALYGKRL
jgi:hypothetical protein